MTDTPSGRRNYRISAIDIPDQILFFLLFGIGSAAIWALKLLYFNQFIVTIVPVGLMAFYAVLAFVTKRYRIREDKVGDNLYYLGFLYTLVSLSHALWAFNPDGSGAIDIITNFGIAIFTTIIGLAGRVFFNQMREDPLEYEREARQSLAQATNELRAQLADICIEMSNFKRKTLQIMEEGVTDISNSTRSTLAENVERFATTSNEVIEKIRAAFSNFTDYSSRLNEMAAKNVEALQALFERIDKIEASPELLATKLEPVIQKFSEVADETLRRNRAQTNDLKRMREVIEVAVTAAETLRKTIAASDKAVTQKMENFATGLEKSLLAAGRFAETLTKLTGTLSSDTASIKSASVELAQAITIQKHTVAEIRAAIEADLQTVLQHRDAMAKLVAESRESVTELQSALVSLSRTMVEQLGGR